MDVRRWPRRIALVLAAGVLALLAAEAGARWILDPPVVNTSMVADPLLGYRLPADVDTVTYDERGKLPYRLNSEGFPGPELPSQPPRPGVERILVVGDSFLNSWMIREEDWIGTVLRVERARAGPEPEVYALCADDYGTAQELLLLRRHIARVAPTVVVLLAYPSNDVVNNSIALAGRTTLSPGDYFRPYLVADGAGGFELRYAQPWKARLRELRLFSIAESHWLARCGVADELREELAGEPDLSMTQRVRRNLLPEEHYELFREPAPGGPWESAWRDTDALLVAFQEEVLRHGARFVATTIPYMLQVQDDAVRVALDERLRVAGKVGLGERLDWNRPELHLEAVFHRAGIPHLQMLGPLRRAVDANGAGAYRRDGHLTGRAHVLMARCVAARLAPDAADECFRADDPPRPIPLARLCPEQVVLDLRAEPFPAFFGWGWGPWEAPGRGLGGWQLPQDGLFLAPHRAGTLTLSGTVLAENEFPVTLAVSFNYRAEIGRQTIAAPGEFVFSVPIEPVPGLDEDWLALKLSLVGRKQAVPYGLALTGMRFTP